MTGEELTYCRYAEIMESNADNLIDLKQVNIAKELPVPMRMLQYMDQVKNPYLFRVDKLIVKATFSGKHDLSSLLANFMAQC